MRNLALILVLSLASFGATAAETTQPQAPTPEMMGDALNAARAQRDQALDQALGLSVELAAARREIERLRREVAARPPGDTPKP